MRKYTFILCFLALHFSFASVGQVTFGVVAGVNYSSFIKNSSNIGLFGNYQPKFGISGGGFWEYGLNEKLGFEGGLKYNSYGCSARLLTDLITGSLNDPLALNLFNESRIIKLEYLSIPMLAKYRLSKISLVAGPQLNYLLKNNFYREKNDIGWTLGADYDLGEKINVSMRYFRGVKHVFTNLQAKNSPRNEALNLSLGYRIN